MEIVPVPGTRFLVFAIIVNFSKSLFPCATAPDNRHSVFVASSSIIPFLCHHHHHQIVSSGNNTRNSPNKTSCSLIYHFAISPDPHSISKRAKNSNRGPTFPMTFAICVGKVTYRWRKLINISSKRRMCGQ